MNSMKSPNPLELSDGNPSENWKKFERELDNFMIATERNHEADEVKIAILQTYIGDDGLALMDSLQIEEHELDDYEELLQRFEARCNSRKNVVMERFKFRNTRQKSGQSIDEFVRSLKQGISSCEYENEDPAEIEDHLVRDQFIIGLSDTKVQQRLLGENDIDLATAVELVKAWEDSPNHPQPDAKYVVPRRSRSGRPLNLPSRFKDYCM